MTTRYYRYNVSGAWGSMTGRLQDDTVMIDTDRGESYDYTVMSTNTGQIIGGWHVEKVGEVTEPDVLAQL